MDGKLLIWQENSESGYFLVSVHQKIARIYMKDCANRL